MATLKKTKNWFSDQLSLNAGQKYCKKLQVEHSAILLTFIKLPLVIKIFVFVYLWVAVLHRCYCNTFPVLSSFSSEGIIHLGLVSPATPHLKETYNSRPLVKSAYQKIFFLFLNQNIMLWVLGWLLFVEVINSVLLRSLEKKGRKTPTLLFTWISTVANTDCQ